VSIFDFLTNYIFMEGLSALLLIVLIVIVLVQNSNLKNYLFKLEREIKLLQKQLQNSLLENVSKPFPPVEKKEIVQTELKPKEPITEAPETKPYVSIFSVEERENIQADFNTTKTIVPAEQSENIQPEKVFVKEEKPIEEKIPNFSAPPIREKVPAPVSLSFFERHPDMEKFIGENLVNKIGIAILVLAIGFFVKYAIDQNWVGPVGRVGIGLLCGGILIGIAHKLRTSYKSFSSVLAGGGLAVFYFTITLAYKQFGLFGQTTAFVIMLVITAFAVALSILYDKQELAIISLVGGFVAPFLVSNGSGNYVTLFIYLIVLNSGLLIIAYHKGWRLLNLLSFLFTILLFGSWLLFLPYASSAVTYRNGFLFAIIFYLLFFAINIAYNVSEKKKFIASDFGILLANTSLFFSAGIYCLNNMGAIEFKGLFAASMGIFNLIATYFLFRKQKMDTNILYLLIGITLTFISITAPLQLHGNYITLFWASEAVLLFWLYTKSKISIIQYSSLLVWALMMVSLLMDWVNLYNGYNTELLSIIFNKAFITGIFSAASTYLLYILTNKEIEKNTDVKLFISNKAIFRIIAFILLFVVGYLEINYQFNNRFEAMDISLLYITAYYLLFVLVAVYISQKVQKIALPWRFVTILLAASIVFYLLSEMSFWGLQEQMFLQNKYGGHFIVHWLSAVLVGVCFYKLVFILKENSASFKGAFNAIVWGLCALIVIFLSIEINLISNSIFFSLTNSFENIAEAYIRTGLPILWGICSFAFMFVGMRYKYKTLRIISLSLFSLTLFKLFAFDIRNISAGGKIAAFFFLGVLLLVVSFMYQRLKKIIIDDEKKID
jgi:Predicted membrane protein (DUF2339)